MDKIDVRDLRVGNWLSVYHPTMPAENIQISADWIRTIEQINDGLIKEDSPLFRIVKPIPLTREILEKNGFVKMASGYYRYFLAYDENYYAGFESVSFYLESYRINALKEEVDGSQSQYTGKCVYLHQLQNILRDLGIEKEITI